MLTYTELTHISSSSIANPDILRLYARWLEWVAGNDADALRREADPDRLWCGNDLMLLERVDERDFLYAHYGTNVARASGFDMTGKRTSDFGSAMGEFFVEKYLLVLEKREPLYTTHRALHARGVRSWERLILPLVDASGGCDTLLVYNAPLALASELLIGVLDGSPDIILAFGALHDDDGEVEDFTIELVNRRAEEVLGVPTDQAEFHRASERLPGLMQPAFMNRCRDVVKDGASQTFEHEMMVGDEPHTYRVSLAPLTTGVVATFTDITRLTQMNADLVTLATTDALTGVANRRHFFDVASRECARSERRNHPLSVIALDIDHFKQVNDRHGHQGGDIVLCHVAELLADTVRREDTLGRLGGEEFAVLLPETPVDRAALLAERLRARVEATPVVVDGVPVSTTCSLGVSLRQAGERDIDNALARADKLLYDAKREGRNRVNTEDAVGA